MTITPTSPKVRTPGGMSYRRHNSRPVAVSRQTSIPCCRKHSVPALTGPTHVVRCPWASMNSTGGRTKPTTCGTVRFSNDRRLLSSFPSVSIGSFVLSCGSDLGGQRIVSFLRELVVSPREFRLDTQNTSVPTWTTRNWPNAQPRLRSGWCCRYSWLYLDGGSDRVQGFFLPRPENRN